MEALIRPVPNRRFLGMYVGLWAHFKSKKENPGFINRFLNKKMGEEPVYLSQVDTRRTEQLLNNRLENRGFFNSRISSDISSKTKFGTIEYIVILSDPYTLAKFEFEVDEDTLEIHQQIADLMVDTEIKEGMRLDLSKFKDERARLDESLKNRGFYKFSPEYLIFEVDTNISGQTRNFNLFLRLKDKVPDDGIIPYSISEIKVFPNYSANEESETLDTAVVKGKAFIQGKEIFRPELLEQYILINSGDRYDPQKSRLTSNRLSSIGTYRYVNLRYSDLDTTGDEGRLEASIYLSPLKKQAIRAELLGISKSNNFAGPELSLNHQNRNLFAGGETLNLSGKIAYETQIAGSTRSGLNSIALGLKADLIYPRLIFIIPIKSQFNYSMPKTKISLGTEYLNRVGLYRLNSFSVNYGYFWNASDFVYHEINPISINIVNLSRTSSDFEDILDKNLFLRRSFDQQFIAGINYTFHYNRLRDSQRKHGTFVGTNVDLAGNTLNLVNNIFGGTPGRFLSLNYAQYAKGDIDLRYYLRVSENQTIATRLFGGIGIPYGNSVSLPFVKQYFSGGPNSIRAFRIRSVGPGTYRPDEFNLGSYFDQAGDIRLEGNLEYRFSIVSIVKGAIFIDAGNVWLKKENQALPGGKFTSTWWKELAVGTGFGLRFDIDFFVIRFDLATPLRKPYLPENERWGNTFAIGDKTWRRENLIFNFAIGYPF
ncbi:MAG: BamA/TamA family outer membrane protein [Saprospiraceae bacterium]|nr:BamA/TamA family outer membrane protein [Saprospiraceae bacterium]